MFIAALIGFIASVVLSKIAEDEESRKRPKVELGFAVMSKDKDMYFHDVVGRFSTHLSPSASLVSSFGIPICGLPFLSQCKSLIVECLEFSGH